MESLDYDPIDSVIELEELSSRHQRWFLKITVQRWLITFFIGFCVALIGFSVDVGTKFISYYKLQLINLTYNACSQCFWAPMFVFLTSNVVLVGVASAMIVWYAPTAAGSGIPEVKCYLNGIKIPEILRFKTLLAKPLGVMFSVAGGLCVGKEGPMIHTGSIVAAGISQGKSSTFACITTPFFNMFRNDHEKRDFVSGGAAAGVAAAFGAPIGGTLFTLEEGSSFWNQGITWRTFFCSMVSTFTLNLFLSGTEKGVSWGSLSNPGLINFGTFDTQTIGGYNIEQVPVFILLGIMGGLLGALFNGLNKKLTLLRMKYVYPSVKKKFGEAIFMGAFTATIAMTLSYFVHECLPIDDTKRSELPLFNYFCEEGTYNDMATLFTTMGETTIKHLLHDHSLSFSTPTLILFFVIYYFLAISTYGVSVPSGLFVPALTIGSAYGRLVGLLVEYFFPQWETNASVFAFVGAASFLGGCTRMTISLCVILMETTSNITFGLPIMFTLMIAKWIGDWFNHGIYDIHIELRKIPILEWEASEGMRGITANQIMNKPVFSFYPVERVGRIYSILKNTTHNGFPIIKKSGQLQGLVLRSQLITLLRSKSFQKENRILTPNDRKVLDIMEFGKYYPRYPGIETVHLDQEDKRLYIDLTPYMSLTPFNIQQNATGDRVFRIFRTMGLRHLPVVNSKSHVVGMITRRDIFKYEERIKSQPSIFSDNDQENAIELRSIRVESLNTTPTHTNNFEEKLVGIDDLISYHKDTTDTMLNSTALTVLSDSVSQSPRNYNNNIPTTVFPLFKVSILLSDDVFHKSLYEGLSKKYPSIKWLYINRSTLLFCETDWQDILSDESFEWPEGVLKVSGLDEIMITPQALQWIIGDKLPISKVKFEKILKIFENRKHYELIDLEVLRSLD